MSLGRRKSPLGTKANDLAAEEAKLRQQMEELENLIKTAPQKIEEQKRRRRDQLIERAAADGNRLDVPASLRGDDLFTTRDRGRSHNRPRLKSEQRAQRLRFLVLTILFFALFALLLSKLL